jgi:superfamily II DNA or RNA helicase
MSKPKITLVKRNHVWGHLVSEDPAILEAANKKFAIPVENYWFMPAYKAGRWDGKIRFVQNDGKFYVGNFKRILKYVYDDEFHEMEVDPAFALEPEDKEKFKEQFLANVDSLDCPFAPYVHQIRGAMKACYYKRGVCRHVTSAGKSLTIALTIHHLIHEKPDHKFLILVPKIDLVEQFVENLEEYGVPPDLVGKFCGYTKEPEAQIVVSTWQSMHKQKALLKEFTVLLVDECHGLKADVVRSVAENAINCETRLGFTGTMPEDKADSFLVEGVLGPIIDEVGYKELQDKNQIAGIRVKVVECEYGEEALARNEVEDYHQERDYIENDEKRNKIIGRIAKEYADNDKNCLILVKKIDHTVILKDLMDRAGVKSFVVTGDTKIADRNEARHSLEESGGNVIIATVGVYSTGVSIKRLHSVIFASPGKSKIQTLQSVGRGLRLHNTKRKLDLFDIAENLRFSKKHLRKRLKYYDESEFEYEVRKVQM